MTVRILRWAAIPVGWITETSAEAVVIVTRRRIHVHHVEQVEVVHHYHRVVTHVDADGSPVALPSPLSTSALVTGKVLERHD